MRRLPVPVLLLVTLGFGSALAGQADQQIDRLLERETPPAGVVFEVVSGNGEALQGALPWIQDRTAQLRNRFPALPVAVVSHGREQFALLSEHRTEQSSVHGLVQQLVTQQEVPVHVCGTHAGWYDKQVEDFPDYVNVAASGPAQIRDYQQLGYELIVVGR